MKTHTFGTALAIVACAMLTPAFAGSKGGGGYGGGGSSNYNKNYNYNKSYSSSRSRSTSSASANNSIVFKNGTDWGNVAFGAAAIIGAFNPPEPQRIIVRGGDVKVQVNFIGDGTPALPGLKSTQPPNDYVPCTYPETGWRNKNGECVDK